MAALTGGGCIVRPVARDAGLRPRFAVVTAHVGREQRAALRRLRGHASIAFAASFSARVGQTRQPVFMPTVSADLLRMWSGPAAWPYLEQFEPCSIMAVSLCEMKEVTGSIVVWRDAPAPPFIDYDLVLAERVAKRLEFIVR
jgi:hypothetical protein